MGAKESFVCPYQPSSILGGGAEGAEKVKRELRENGQDGCNLETEASTDWYANLTRTLLDPTLNTY